MATASPSPRFTTTGNNTSNGSTNVGYVKWFNNKAGYGFITTSDQKDIFVHHSSINIDKNMYKYLVQGEYISYDLEEVTNDKYTHQAKNIRGVNGGPLMCETRNENARHMDKFPQGRAVNKVDLGKQWMLVQRQPNRNNNGNNSNNGKKKKDSD